MLSKKSFLILVSAGLALLGASAQAQEFALTTLSGNQQVPPIITPGTGTFIAEINAERTEIGYTLSFQELRGEVLQAHIHLAQEAVNGGIMLFICSNLGNAPAGTPECPAADGEVSGAWTEDDVITIPDQGLTGDGPIGIRRAVKAMRKGIAYVNVHSSLFPPGEIRGQITGTTRTKVNELVSE